MKIWAIEYLDVFHGWKICGWEDTRESARIEKAIWERTHKSDKFRVRAYQRVEGSK